MASAPAEKAQPAAATPQAPGATSREGHRAPAEATPRGPRATRGSPCRRRGRAGSAPSSQGPPCACRCPPLPRWRGSGQRPQAREAVACPGLVGCARRPPAGAARGARQQQPPPGSPRAPSGCRRRQEEDDHVEPLQRSALHPRAERKSSQRGPRRRLPTTRPEQQAAQPDEDRALPCSPPGECRATSASHTA